MKKQNNECSGDCEYCQKDNMKKCILIKDHSHNCCCSIHRHSRNIEQKLDAEPMFFVNDIRFVR